MPNKSLLSKVTDEAARKVIFHLILQIEALKLKIDRLEQKMKPTQAIGFHQNPSASTMEMAFPNRSFKGGD